MKTTALPVAGSTLGAEIRTFLRAATYAPCSITEALAFVEANGTATGCPSLLDAECDAVNALIVRHTSHAESDPSEWPAVYDEWVWATDDEPPAPEPEPFHPTPEDERWAAALFRASVDRFETEDYDWLSTHAGSVDALCAGLVPDDLPRYPVRSPADDGRY